MARDDEVVAADASSQQPDQGGHRNESDASALDAELAESLGLDGEHDASDDPAPPVPTQPVDLTKSANPAATAEPESEPETAAEPGKKKRGGKKRGKAPWWELPVLVAVAIAVAVLIKSFLVQPFYIPSESMEKTLHGCAGCSGDRILVNKPIYHLRDPHPGDIVVFRAPTDQWFNEPLPAKPGNPVTKGFRWFGQLVGLIPPDEHDLVKRVIAVGGQTIQGKSDGTVQVSDNGTAGPWRTLTEPYVSAPLSAAEATFGPVTIPKGRLWVMGDNRAHSDDSRYHYQNEYRGDAVLSTVPTGNVIGKAVVIAWPPSRWRTLGTPSTFKHASAAAASALPLIGAFGLVLPIWGIRRRRRRPA